MTSDTESIVDTEEPTVPSTIGVEVNNTVATKQVPADFGSYATYVFSGTEDKVMILGEDPARSGAVILVTGTGNGVLYLGSAAQCSAVKVGNVAGAGFILPIGFSLSVTHKQAVWVVPDGVNAVTVSVAIERRRMP